MSTENQNNLKKRYLVWFYKSVKEELDKIDRYFTQNEIDVVLLKRLRQSLKNNKNPKINQLINDFAVYAENKFKRAKSLRFVNVDSKQELPEYVFLKTKLEALEFAITKEFGPKELKRIKHLYEQEMTTRILQSREH